MVEVSFETVEVLTDAVHPVPLAFFPPIQRVESASEN